MAKKERNRRSARQARSRERAEREELQAKAGAQVAQATKAKEKEKAVQKAGKPGFLQRASDYIAAVKQEMQRVTWPSKPELRSYTVGVIAWLVIAGVVVWLVDTGLLAALVGFSGLRG